MTTMLSDEQRSRLIALLREDAQSFYDGDDNETLIDYLVDGFKGWKNMTDEELQHEAIGADMYLWVDNNIGVTTHAELIELGVYTAESLAQVLAEDAAMYEQAPVATP